MQLRILIVFVEALKLLKKGEYRPESPGRSGTITEYFYWNDLLQKDGSMHPDHRNLIQYSTEEFVKYELNVLRSEVLFVDNLGGGGGSRVFPIRS
jgi:hypothetical protein